LTQVEGLKSANMAFMRFFAWQLHDYLSGYTDDTNSAESRLADHLTLE
jgi:hypothetical protein